MKQTIISKKFKFDASHMIANHFGKCKNLHGHTYTVVIYLRYWVNERTGVVLDYYDINNNFKNLIDIFDHSFICYRNDPIQLNIAEILKQQKNKIVYTQKQTTAENLAALFYKEAKKIFVPFDIKIKIKETENTSAVYGDF